MLNFSDWLINERADDIQYGMWSKDGTVVIYINGKRYQYMTDPMYHERWQRMARFAPWKAFNEIKKHASKMQPKISKSCPNCQGCPHCGTSSPNFQFGIECPGCGEVTNEL